jgi:hypothetical protein
VELLLQVVSETGSAMESVEISGMGAEKLTSTIQELDVLSVKS